MSEPRTLVSGQKIVTDGFLVSPRQSDTPHTRDTVAAYSRARLFHLPANTR